MGSGSGGDPIDRSVLEALAARADEGMTILELRHHLPADIDTIESSLERLGATGRIETERGDGRVRVYPTDAGLALIEGDDDRSVLDRLRQFLPP